MNSFEEIIQTPTFVWLERFHINNYVRPTDHREFNRPTSKGRSNSGISRMIEKERRRRFKDDVRVDNSLEESQIDV